MNPRVATPSQRFKIQGMHCASCVSRIENAIRHNVPGVQEVSVNLATETAFVAGKIDSRSVVGAIQQAGYTASPLQEEFRDFEADTATHKTQAAQRRFLQAAVCSLPVVVLGMFHLHFPGSDWIQLGLSTVVLAGGGHQFFSRAWQQAGQGQADMDTLVALGTGAAYGSGVVTLLGRHTGQPLYFESAVVIITLILYGRYLEALASSRAGSAIQKLMALQPKQARVNREGDWRLLPIEEVHPGEKVMIQPGESIPLDGTVLEGYSTVNEAMVTGESLPVEKQPGAPVIGGTLNQAGSLLVRVTQVGRETFLAQMIRLVEAAQASKPPIQRLVDRVAGVFVPVVLLLALLTLGGWLWAGVLWGQALQATIAVLIIACPCALGLATPTAIRVGTGQAANLGILIRNLSSLEKAAKLDILVLDKTGTLTAGHPEVLDLINASGLPDADWIQRVASLESFSEHPFAQAIVRYAKTQGIALESPVQDFQAVIGSGVSGKVAEMPVLIGQEAFLRSHAVDFSILPVSVSAYETTGHSLLHVAMAGRWVGLWIVADPVKQNAQASIAGLRTLGIQPVMLTGDRLSVAEAIAAQVGLQVNAGEVVANVSPSEKLAYLQALQAQRKTVGMVGDGINDAPALAQADVGFALGTGTDIAMAAADITLVHGDIAKAATAIELSRKMMTVIRQNLFWAFFYNIVAIPLAAFGLLNPMIAAAAMAFSSVSVVANSLRLKGFR